MRLVSVLSLVMALRRGGLANISRWHVMEKPVPSRMRCGKLNRRRAEYAEGNGIVARTEGRAAPSPKLHWTLPVTDRYE